MTPPNVSAPFSNSAIISHHSVNSAIRPYNSANSVIVAYLIVAFSI